MVPEYVLGMHYTPALQRELAAHGKVGMNVCTSMQWDTRLPSFQGELQDVLHLKQWEGGVFSPNCHPLTYASGEHAAAKLLDGRMFFGGRSLRTAPLHRWQSASRRRPTGMCRPSWGCSPA
eukprot:7300400-Prymnesium_polylepis.1